MLLIAQASREPPLEPPPARLGSAERKAWLDIVHACPDVLRRPDGLSVELAARMVAAWRDGLRNRESLLLTYRMLGDLLMRMSERRRLLFPDRTER